MSEDIQSTYTAAVMEMKVKDTRSPLAVIFTLSEFSAVSVYKHTHLVGNAKKQKAKSNV